MKTGLAFLMREDVTRLEKFDAQVRLLNREQIDTAEQLTAYTENTDAKIQTLYQKRTELRNDLKRAKRSGDTEQAALITAQIAAISKELRGLRKEVRLCTDIMERSEQVALNLDEHKSQFIMSLVEQIDRKGVGPQQKSIIDRCTAAVYREAEQSGMVPTLNTLRQKLLEQPELKPRKLPFPWSCTPPVLWTSLVTAVMWIWTSVWLSLIFTAWVHS